MGVPSKQIGFTHFAIDVTLSIKICYVMSTPKKQLSKQEKLNKMHRQVMKQLGIKEDLSDYENATWSVRPFRPNRKPSDQQKD